MSSTLVLLGGERRGNSVLSKTARQCDKLGMTPNFSRPVPNSRSHSQASEENHSPTCERADQGLAASEPATGVRERRARPPPPVFKNPWLSLETGGVTAEIDAVLHSFPVPPSPRLDSGSFILGSFDGRAVDPTSSRQQSAQTTSEHQGSPTWSPIYSARTSTSSNHEDSFCRRQSGERLNFSRPSLRSSTLSHSGSHPAQQARMMSADHVASDVKESQPRSSC
ncbi:uncharacterized protein K489DRAFT_373459 [Dissoconium aciculare CBS 342.82]|uniref:Uncharacterized protein n=1 Tax=Dissoconium aciculare CBS 342.82 TaxID=1314786 RepID=A0A6J3LV27_9PEZI|nr:uncharacterized protein K489DRAFT_373459 [Dissoconium aciculare CBS 342.82]KAF1819620.1 hypothetical protein K489DRAFT_373459 [Dissoconium aciculare CBS 342.82]